MYLTKAENEEEASYKIEERLLNRGYGHFVLGCHLSTKEDFERWKRGDRREEL